MVVLNHLNPNTACTGPAPSDRSFFGSSDPVETVPVQTRRRTKVKDRSEIVRLYESGLSSRAVAERVRIAKSSVLRILKEAGVEMRAPGVRY